MKKLMYLCTLSFGIFNSTSDLCTKELQKKVWDWAIKLQIEQQKMLDIKWGDPWTPESTNRL